MEKTTVLYAYYRDLDFFCHRDPSTAAALPILSENLSFIGNALHHRGLLVLWGTCTACYFWFAFLTISHLSALIPKRIALYCALACLLMVIATILPYDEGRVPMLSFLHTAAASILRAIGTACLFINRSIIGFIVWRCLVIICFCYSVCF